MFPVPRKDPPRGEFHDPAKYITPTRVAMCRTTASVVSDETNTTNQVSAQSINNLMISLERNVQREPVRHNKIKSGCTQKARANPNGVDVAPH